ncbi:TPA: type I glyceraldehyde-3-phosphate dehydrogenase [Patescibacteria group bacterium]|nr:type I glyceraldehyde-3-phosphate dehydrogenase [Candidatus Gracilibacteria bacterium]
MKKVAINGFGRIGRLFLRKTLGNPNFEIVAINDLGDVENLAYLLKYDTVYGRYEKEVSFIKTEGKNAIVVDGKEIAFISEKDPTLLPWGTMGIDLVVESTGVYESFEKNQAHITAGAKRVVISAPAKDADGAIGQTVLMGINEDKMSVCPITSNASCTTNGISPVVAVLSEKLGIVKAMMTTAHAYTNTQTMVDSPVKGADFRRGRAGAQNIVPSTTGAAIAVTRAFKELEGKFDGIALRIPVPSGSVADITFLAARPTTVEEVNAILTEAAQTEQWKGILTVTDEQIVSSDVLRQETGALVDLRMTKVVAGDLVKVLSWYDNEWGYSNRLIEMVITVGKSISK